MIIRTIVVDDEPYLRKSIKSSIETMNPSYQVIAEAGNGVQAYNLIAELQPDVVFLDIRMPVMDGISLLEKLHQNGICPIRVILSGYSEFEYAKKAIQFGVFDYVLKPIHLEQLSALLSGIAERIMQKRISSEYEYWHYLLKGIKPSLPVDKLTLAMEHYREYYCIYLIAGSYMYTKNNQFNPVGEIWGSSAMLSGFARLCAPDDRLWSVSGENQNELLLIIGSPGRLNSISKLAADTYNFCLASSIPITILYSPCSSDLKSIRETVINLKYFSVQNVCFGHSTLVEWNDRQNKIEDRSLLSEMNIHVLQAAVREQRYQDFKKYIKSIMNYFDKNRTPQYQLRLELIRILEILQGNYVSSEIQDFVNESITNALTYEDITDVLLQYIDDYAKNYYRDISQDLAGMIKDYIDENFETQLTLKEIAMHFHISPSYLSTVFKKTFAISPNEYIMNKRISKAKDLLSIFPPISIKQIAGMIGYTDPFYFSRIFKMITGTTPSEYRLDQK